MYYANRFTEVEKCYKKNSLMGFSFGRNYRTGRRRCVNTFYRNKSLPSKFIRETMGIRLDDSLTFGRDYLIVFERLI